MNRRKMILAFAGGVLLLGVLAAGLSLLRPFAGIVSAQGPAPERVMVIAVEENINGESFAGEVRVTFDDPAELPVAPADADGLFLSRDGSTMTLGGGSIQVEVGVEAINDQEPTTSIQASHSGDEMTVLITADTQFFMDNTARPKITPADIEAGELVVSRTIVPGSPDDLAENMLVRVWGTEQDGQLVADVLVYEPIK